jgi:NADH-quinone oxidoreductase subunit J
VIAFWILAPIMVIAALGLLFVRKAVHAAMLLAVVMMSLAVLYAALDAPFLFAVHIIVYTGAILMLFLFVLMLVGVDASDSIVETIRGQRLLAIVGGLMLGLILVIGLGQISLGSAVGLSDANEGGNIQALADILFSREVFAFETTSALLITAAVGAMVLAHRERLTPKATQQAQAAQRVKDYAEQGTHLGPLPPPGVYARHNAVDTPALLPDGTAAESSVSRVLAARGTVRSAPAMADDIDEIEGQIGWSAHAGRDPAAPVTTTEEAPATGGESCSPPEARRVSRTPGTHLAAAASLKIRKSMPSLRRLAMHAPRARATPDGLTAVTTHHEPPDPHDRCRHRGRSPAGGVVPRLHA